MSKQFKQQFKPLNKSNEQDNATDENPTPEEPGKKVNDGRGGEEESNPDYSIVEVSRIENQRMLSGQQNLNNTRSQDYVSHDDEWVKVAAKIPPGLNMKLKAYNYWQRTSNDELIFKLLSDFLSKSDVPPLPKEQRLKKKRGRKPKRKSDW
jgi:hypothetical protein